MPKQAMLLKSIALKAASTVRQAHGRGGLSIPAKRLG